MGSLDDTRPHGDRSRVEPLNAKQLQPRNCADDVDQGVQCAQLMRVRRGVAGRRAVYRALRLLQQPQHTQAAVGHGGREATVGNRIGEVLPAHADGLRGGAAGVQRDVDAGQAAAPVSPSRDGAARHRQLHQLRLQVARAQAGIQQRAQQHIAAGPANHVNVPNAHAISSQFGIDYPAPGAIPPTPPLPNASVGTTT